MVRDYAKRFPLGHKSFFSVLVKKQKWYGTQNYKPEGKWNSTAGVMVASVQDSGHPCFRASSALDRGFCGLWRLFECSNSLVATYCRQLLSVPCLSGKCAQMSVECGFGVRAPVCMCLVIRVVILEFEFMWDNTIPSFGRVQKNDHRQHCHVGNAGPALSTGLIPRLRLCWRGHTMWKDMLKDHDIQFEESGHPVYIQSFQCVGSWILEGFLNKKGGRCTIHFSADPSNAELFFRTINSANQLSIYGAIADWCYELTQQIPGQSLFSSMESSIANERAVMSKNWRKWVRTNETSDQAAIDRLRVHLRSLNWRDSWGKSLLNASEQLWC